MAAQALLQTNAKVGGSDAAQAMSPFRAQSPVPQPGVNWRQLAFAALAEGGFTAATSELAPERRAYFEPFSTGVQAEPGGEPQWLSRAPSQPEAPADEGLGVLDNALVNAMLEEGLGEWKWGLMREFLRGMVSGVRSGVAQGKDRQFLMRLAGLARDPSAMLELQLGYTMGVGKGVWQSIKDIFDLLLLGPRLQLKMTQWFMEQGLVLLANHEQVALQVGLLAVRFEQLSSRVGAALLELLNNPRQAMEGLEALSDTLMKSAMGQARAAGLKTSSAIFEFLELPWREFGEKLGFLAGMVLFEVLQGVATEGLGPVLKAMGSAVARGGRWTAAQAARALRVLREVMGELKVVAVRLKDGVLKVFQKVLDELVEFMESLKSFVHLMEDGLHPPLAADGVGSVPSHAWMSQSKPPGKGPPGLGLRDQRGGASLADKLPGAKSPPARAGRWVDELVPGLYDSVKLAENQGDWMFIDKSTKIKTFDDSESWLMRTGIEFTRDGNTATGFLHQGLKIRVNPVTKAQEVELTVRNVSTKYLKDGKWINTGKVDFRKPGEGVPIHIYATIRQLKQKGVGLGALRKVDLHDIINEETILQVAKLQRRHRNGIPSRLLMETDLGRYGQSVIVQAGGRIRGAKIVGGETVRVADVVKNTEFNDASRLMEEFGLKLDDEVTKFFSIVFDVD